jgi:hypothetical protein
MITDAFGIEMGEIIPPGSLQAPQRLAALSYYLSSSSHILNGYYF